MGEDVKGNLREFYNDRRLGIPSGIQFAAPGPVDIQALLSNQRGQMMNMPHDPSNKPNYVAKPHDPTDRVAYQNVADVVMDRMRTMLRQALPDKGPSLKEQIIAGLQGQRPVVELPDRVNLPQGLGGKPLLAEGGAHISDRPIGSNEPHLVTQIRTDVLPQGLGGKPLLTDNGRTGAPEALGGAKPDVKTLPGGAPAFLKPDELTAGVDKILEKFKGGQSIGSLVAQTPEIASPGENATEPAKIRGILRTMDPFK